MRKPGTSLSFRYPTMFAALCLLMGCGRCDRNSGPPSEPVRGPTPSDESAGEPSADPALDSEWPAVAEQFADMLVLRYRVAGFERLTLRERKLAYYLQQASLSGRDIVYDQRFRHNLAVRRTLEAVIQTYRGDRTTEAYAGVVQYAKRVFFANGIHHPVSGAPMRPLRLTATEFAVLVQQSDASKLPLAPGQSVGGWIATLTPLLFGEADTLDHDATPLNDDVLASSRTHLYVNVTASEADAYYAAAEHGLRHPRNSRLRKHKGILVEDVYKQGGLYGEALGEMVRWLHKAREVAGGEHQAAALTHLARYYETGDPQEFEAYSEAWRADAESAVDVLQGFLNTGPDPLGLKGTFGSLVSLNDHEATERLQTLVRHAQWFEDHAPIDPAYRRTDAGGITARAMEVVISAGSHAPVIPVGAHLPLDPLVHDTFGTKGITLSNVLHAQAQARLHNGVLSEFVLSEREERRARAHGAGALALLAGLHEVIGHAAGKLEDGVAAPSTTLKQYAATIEEARADLYALYFLFDPKLIELGLMSTFEVARAGYDGYVRRALLLSLQGLDQDAPIEQPLVSASRLVVHWARARDSLPSPVVQRVLRDGETYFVITDYLKLRRYFGELLAELQRITSQGDHEAARKLVMKYATGVERPLYEQVRRRNAALQLPTTMGFLEPRLVAERDGEAILDVRLRYPSDFLTQQLEDSEAFSFLPTYTD